MTILKKSSNQIQLCSDYEWLLMQSLSQYEGQWIAVSEKKIVARDIVLKKVLEKVASRSLSKMPLYLRVPEGSVTAMHQLR